MVRAENFRVYFRTAQFLPHIWGKSRSFVFCPSLFWVADDDMGKVIGKQGRIAKAIRTVVKAAASKEDKKVIVEIQQ